MTERDLKVVIPSRRRVESCRLAFSLVPFADICVAEEERADYKEFGRALWTHPDTVTGVAHVRRWILEQYKQRCVVIFDDDVYRVSCLVGRKSRRIDDPAAIRRILLNSAAIAEGIGASLFSYAITANILDFMPYDPFALLESQRSMPRIRRPAHPPRSRAEPQHRRGSEPPGAAERSLRLAGHALYVRAPHHDQRRRQPPRHHQGKLGARSAATSSASGASISRRKIPAE